MRIDYAHDPCASICSLCPCGSSALDLTGFSPINPRLLDCPAMKGMPWRSEMPRLAPFSLKIQGLQRTELTLKECKMPKLKTKSGVKKRFTLTASGKVKRGQAGKQQDRKSGVKGKRGSVRVDRGGSRIIKK